MQGFLYNYLKTIIGPTSKLHITILVVKWEPGDVDRAAGHEDAGWDVGAKSLVGHHYVGRVGRVKGFTGT